MTIINDQILKLDKWRYIETAYGAEVEAGEFTIHLHWKGPIEADRIRATARLIASSPTLAHQVIALRDTLGRAEWTSPEHAEDILSSLIRFHYNDLSQALAGIPIVYVDAIR